MENQTLDSEAANGDFSFSPILKASLYNAAKWAKFLSVLGFIYIGLLLISAVVGGMFMPFGTVSPMANISPFVFFIILLVVALIYFFPIYFLFKFASNAQKAINSGKQQEMEESFSNLSRHYQLVGIYTIVMLALYLVFVVIGFLNFG